MSRQGLSTATTSNALDTSSSKGLLISADPAGNLEADLEQLYCEVKAVKSF